MTDQEREQVELMSFIQRHLVGLAVTILVFLACCVVLVYLYETEIIQATQWIDENFGFWGLSALLFVGDTVLSPVPPDVLMLLISKGPMKENWAFYVTAFGMVSSFAGINGYFIGRYLSDRKWARDWASQFSEKNEKLVRKYGFWAVAIGALTPFPFSFTCITAGFLHLDFRIMLPAALLRIPRFFIYYFAIEYGTKILGVF